MYKLLLPIVVRKRLFGALIALCLGMFVLMQVLFRTYFANGPEVNVPPIPPDARSYYTAGELIALLDALGPTGRLIYLRLHLLDTVFPLVYGLFFASLIVFFWGVRGGAVRAASLFAVVPVVAALSDLTENISIQMVSAMFSPNSDAVRVAALAPHAASLSGVATALKWISAAVSVLLVLASVVFLRVRERRG